jgi:hypothetical protein
MFVVYIVFNEEGIDCKKVLVYVFILMYAVVHVLKYISHFQY